MITISKILGVATDPNIQARLHNLDHLGTLEYLIVERNDTLRRRLRGVTDKNTELIIALNRDEKLTDGSILFLDDSMAIVVRMTDERWLGIIPVDLNAALETGYFVGNLHWRVRFENGVILVAIEGLIDHYQSRLEPLLAQRKIKLTEHA